MSKDELLTRFGELTVYLGQLEFNITQSKDALAGMKKSKCDTLNEMYQIQSELESTQDKPAEVTE